MPDQKQRDHEKFTIEEKIHQIMLAEELSSAEKLDRLHALIPLDAFKIDNLNQATPAQLRQLKDGLAVTEAMQQIRRAELLAKNQSGLDGRS
jgi:hypothetical protein